MLHEKRPHRIRLKPHANFTKCADEPSIDPGLLAESDRPVCFRRRRCRCSQRSPNNRQTGVGARQAAREGILERCQLPFRSVKDIFTPLAWMTREQNLHAFGVDDTFLVHIFAA